MLCSIAHIQALEGISRGPLSEAKVLSVRAYLAILIVHLWAVHAKVER